MKTGVMIVCFFLSVKCLAAPQMGVYQTQSGNVIIKVSEDIQDGYIEHLYVVTQVFKLGAMEIHEGRAPIRLEPMVNSFESFGRLEDMIPGNLIKGVFNWVSEYVYRKLSQLLNF